MSWVGPAARNAAKYGVKYGPQAKVAWDIGGKHVQAAARKQLDNVAARRKAFEQAELVKDGSVLKTIHQGTQIWVVFSADEPVAAYPSDPTADPTADPMATPPGLTELVSHADLSNRETPADHRAKQLRQRARRAREQMPKRATGPRSIDSTE